MSLKPGDIYNERGDIYALDDESKTLRIIESGHVVVSLEQAEAARPYGWVKLETSEEFNEIFMPDECCIIRRDVQSLIQ